MSNLPRAVKSKRTKIRGPGIDESLLRPGHRWSASAAFSVTHPELASQWHKTKNGERTPDEYTYGSNELVWWNCPAGKDHIFKTSIKGRTKRGNGCPFCAGHKASVTNSLASLFPKVAKEFHSSKNGELQAKDIVAFSQKKYWWQCPVNVNHAWEACVANRTGNGTGCPFCAGTVVSDQNSLTVLYPEIRLYWHPTKNKNLSPDDVSFKSQKKVWWSCPKNRKEHVWQKDIASITANFDSRTHGCPFCSGKKLCKSNTLAHCRPDLAEQFHPTLNKDVTPDSIFVTTEKQIWWQCSVDAEHVWLANPYRRVNRGDGCPYCAKRSWLVKTPKPKKQK